jgi:hypothetical protein
VTARSIGDILRDLVIRAIEAEHGNPAEQKARVLIARECGQLNESEADDWIRILELEAA